MKVARSIVAVALLAVSGIAMGLSKAAPPLAWTEPITNMQFVTIPAGAFSMGSPPLEKDREIQEVQHEVRLTRPFLLGRLEVTQRQWRVIMKSNPSHFADRGDDFPVEGVNFASIEEFLRRLNAGQEARTFRLPTEAEWEYACRAGTTTAFSTGDALAQTQANVRAETNGRGTTRAGAFPANAWGLHDMHGNVWEWTADDYCPYPRSSVADPRSRCDSGLKVIRGGSWYFGKDSARCALRYTHPPGESGFSLGFRVAADVR